MNTYSDAAWILGNRESKKLGNNTYLHRVDADTVAVRLHQTDVVTYKKNGHIILNSGGWKTATTKDRINTYSPFRIYQEKGLWSVSGNGFETMPFVDMIDFGQKSDGTYFTKTAVKKKTDAEIRLLKLIDRYIKAMKKLDELPIPNTGDCWYCLLHSTKDGKPFGEVVKDTEHLIKHLEETYIHGSLIVNALIATGHQNPQLIYQMGLRDIIYRAVRNYFKKELGLAN